MISLYSQTVTRAGYLQPPQGGEPLRHPHHQEPLRRHHWSQVQVHALTFTSVPRRSDFDTASKHFKKVGS
jgi:hypothetical protein